MHTTRQEVRNALNRERKSYIRYHKNVYGLFLCQFRKQKDTVIILNCSVLLNPNEINASQDISSLILYG